MIIGDGGSPHEKLVHALAAGEKTGALFTDDVRCPVHVTDLASALLELARLSYSGIHHVAGADAVSRYELVVLIARRDGLDETGLPAGRRNNTGLPGPVAVRGEAACSHSTFLHRSRGVPPYGRPIG